MTPLLDYYNSYRCGKFLHHYCGVDQRLSHEAHNLGIVGSSPTLRNQYALSTRDAFYEQVVKFKYADANEPLQVSVTC